jgi:putative transposase
MPRINTPLVSGERYHIYNRGVDKRVVYLDIEDYLRFYQTLAFFNTPEPTMNYRLAQGSYSDGSKKLVEINAYSLLPNHFHLIVEQLVDGGISEFMKRLSGGYTNYFNEKYDRSGSLFQGKFKRVHISSDEQFNYLFSYVNENHSVHDLSFERQICHSSSLHFQGIMKSKLISNNDITYRYKEAVLLAKDIFKKRNAFKDVLE